MPTDPEVARASQERIVIARVPAHNNGVRECVAISTAFLSELGASEQDLTAVELAVAEVMNNVVEHAYSDTSPGNMTLEIKSALGDVNFKVVDRGKPMPKNRLPMGQAADTELEDFEQDEGGYGLFMIRQLAKKLRYARVGEENHLTFRMTLGSHHHWDSDVAV